MHMKIRFFFQFNLIKPFSRNKQSKCTLQLLFKMKSCLSCSIEFLDPIHHTIIWLFSLNFTQKQWPTYWRLNVVFFNSFSSFDSYKKQLDSSLEFKRGNCQNRNTFWFDGICFIRIKTEKNEHFNLCMLNSC